MADYRDLTPYKYQLKKTLLRQTSIRPVREIRFPQIGRPFISLDKNGVLVLLEGYAWNGPSGPTLDDETNIIPSAFHDAGCQLWECGLISDSDKAIIDKMFYDMLIESGMGKFRAWYYYNAVRIFGRVWAGK